MIENPFKFRIPRPTNKESEKIKLLELISKKPYLGSFL
jgi:hypothetical protein